MKINCIAIDDEPLALEIISDYVERFPFLNLLATFTSATESISFIKQNKIDLIFLDIQMEELTGIQLLNIINPHPHVIFTTAYDSYALQGYELDVIDYLLKPFSFERFAKAVDKAYEKIIINKTPTSTGSNEVQNEKQKDSYIFIKADSKMRKIELNDILYIEGQGDYLKIVTNKERIMALLNFKKIEEILPDERFIRVHKSYIIAVDKIEYVEKSRIKIADQLIPVSDTYKKHFQHIIGKHGINY
jgi:two-component system, LytTR family, response regulator